MAAAALSTNQLVARLFNFIPYFILVLAVLFTFAYVFGGYCEQKRRAADRAALTKK